MFVKNLKKIVALGVVSVALVACSSGNEVTKADNPDTAETMTKKSEMMAAEAEPALGGYCPVAYVAAGKALMGKAEYAVTEGEATYWFVSADAMKAYQASPEKFQLPLGELCPTALAMGKQIKGDPTIFSVHEGAIYLFVNEDAKAAFDADPVSILASANENYASLR